MERTVVALVVFAGFCGWAVACDSDAPLPTSGRELRSERIELQRRLAQVEQRLAALEGTGRAPSSTAPATRLAAPGAERPTQRDLPPGCYVGPRGGTYTITKSGRKNYSGC